MSILVNLFVLEKAFPSIVSNPGGNTIVSRLIAPETKEYGITLRFGGSITDLKDVIFENTACPKSVILCGRFKFSTPLDWKAWPFIVVKTLLFGSKLTIFKFDALWKDWSPIVTIVLGISMLVKVKLFLNAAPFKFVTFGAIAIQSAKVMVVFLSQPRFLTANLFRLVPKNGSKVNSIKFHCACVKPHLWVSPTWTKEYFILILVKLGVFKNTVGPLIDVTEGGIIIDSILLFLNVPSLIAVNLELSWKVMNFKPESEKTPVPIVVTELGIVILSNFGLPLNASCPIFVILAIPSKITLSKPRLKENAPNSILSIFLGIWIFFNIAFANAFSCILMTFGANLAQSSIVIISLVSQPNARTSTALKCVPEKLGNPVHIIESHCGCVRPYLCVFASGVLNKAGISILVKWFMPINEEFDNNNFVDTKFKLVIPVSSNALFCIVKFSIGLFWKTTLVNALAPQNEWFKIDWRVGGNSIEVNVVLSLNASPIITWTFGACAIQSAKVMVVFVFQLRRATCASSKLSPVNLYSGVAFSFEEDTVKFIELICLIENPYATRLGLCLSLMVMFFNEVVFKNVEFPISIKGLEIVIEDNCEEAKAKLPIDLTDSGIIIDFKLDASNAWNPIDFNWEFCSKFNDNKFSV